MFGMDEPVDEPENAAQLGALADTASFGLSETSSISGISDISGVSELLAESFAPVMQVMEETPHDEISEGEVSSDVTFVPGVHAPPLYLHRPEAWRTQTPLSLLFWNRWRPSFCNRGGKVRSLSDCIISLLTGFHMQSR